MALAVAALRILGAVEKKMAPRFGVMRYAVTANDGEELARIVYSALDRCHFQDGPLVFDRKGDTTAMQFAFCSPQTLHREFAAALQQLPSVLDVRVE